MVVGPHTILTASHILWDAGSSAAFDDLSLYPAYSANGLPQPGVGDLTTGWTAHFFHVGNANGTISTSDSQSDYAVIDVSYTFSNWMGIQSQWPGGTVHLTGYPTSSNGLQTDNVGTVTEDDQYWIYNYGSLTSEQGNSGGPLWIDTDPSANVTPYVVGLASSVSWACQFSNSAFDQIVSWVTSDGYSLSTGGGGGGGAVDLTVSLYDVNTNTGLGGSPSTTTVAGGQVIFHQEIFNSGGTASGAGNIGYYISTDSTITINDTLIVYANLFDAVPANGSTGAQYNTVTLPTGLTPGTYYVGIIVDKDNSVAESNDNNNASVGRAITITGSVNQAPSISSNGGGATANLSIPENTTSVTTVTAIDPDGTTPVYSISGGTDQAKFTINSTTGALRFITAPDFEAPTDSDLNNTYIVQVRASDGSLSDSQTITVNVTDVGSTPTDDYSNDSSTTGTVGTNGVATGNIETSGDADWFKVILSANIPYIIKLEGSPTSSGTLSDPYLRLHNSAGTVIASDDDSGYGRNSELFYTPGSDGTFYIEASGYTTNTGSYAAHVLRVINGASGNDILTGTSKNELMTGGGGKDTMTGGVGNDTFDFNLRTDSVKGANHDVIMDFSGFYGEGDKIDLIDIDAKKGSGNQAFHFIGAAKFHHKAGELHVLNKGGFFLVEGDTNGDGRADFQIEVHSALALLKADFIL